MNAEKIRAKSEMTLELSWASTLGHELERQVDLGPICQPEFAALRLQSSAAARF